MKLKYIKPYFGEDYDVHWNYTEFKDKIILDLGADNGSSAYYFLSRGARGVIAVEADKDRFKELENNYKKSLIVRPVLMLVENPIQVSNFLDEYDIDIVKVDIENHEKTAILPLPRAELIKANEWLIEAHSNDLMKDLRYHFESNGFAVSVSRYLSGCLWVLYCRREDSVIQVCQGVRR